MISALHNGRELQLSERLVYKGLVQSGELTTSELVKYTGGSQSSVYRILCALVDQGLVVQSPGSPRGGNGRRPIAYKVNADAIYIVGAFLRWDVFGVGLCTVDGTVVARSQSELKSSTTPTEVVAFMGSEVDRMLGEHDVPREKVLGFGLTTTGPLLKEKGILYHPHHIEQPNWEVVPIRDMLEMATRMHVSVNNLASAALRGELMRRKEGLAVRSSYILLDEGVGTDTYVPGAADRTSDDQSAAFGSIVIDFRNTNGRLSSYASIDAIYDQFHAAFPSGLEQSEATWSGDARALWQSDGRLHAVRRLIDALDSTERARAEGVLSQISAALGAGISTLVGLLNPRVVYYGGRVVHQLPEALDAAIKLAAARRPPECVSPVEYVRSDLDDELLIRGAVYRVLDDKIGLFMPVTA